jgi:uncharacterized membrane protein
MNQKGAPALSELMIPVAAGVIHASYWFCYSKAYEKGDLSHVYPIMRSSPFLVLILAVLFLGEKITVLGWAGILLVTLGIFIVNLKKLSLKGVMEPFRAITREKSVQMALGALVLSALYSIVDKVGVSLIHPIVYAFTLSLSACFLFSFYILKTKSLKEVWAPWQTDKKSLLMNGLISAINYPLLLFALTLSNVSYVTGLRQMSIVFATVLGGLVLKEQHQTTRLLGSALIAVGAIAIAGA